MEELENLAKKLDEIDEIFGNAGKDRSDPSWAKRVNQKDRVAKKIGELCPTIPQSFPFSSFLLSPSTGHQTVAVIWIRFKKDPTHLNVICYMLLNSPSNFLTYYTLQALASIMDQCDYHQLIQIEQTLLSYCPPDQTSRSEMKLQLLAMIKPQTDFSITDIIKDSYWWRDVESKFFNSLSGISKYRLRGLQVIRNKQLFERFNNYRAQLGQNTQLLFVYHGSTHKSLQAIAKTGFLEPDMLTHMSDKISTLDQGFFGRGIYHGFAADYAIYYAEKYKTSDEIMLSMVLPDRSYIVKKGREKYGQACEPGFDSHISPEYKEIVLFNSAQILPLFIIRFERVDNKDIVEEQP